LYAHPAPALDKNAILCHGAARLLQPAQNYTSYLWNNGNTNKSIEINTTGTYWVTVTDDHGCKGTDTTRITTIVPPPVGFLPPDTVICQYGKLTIAPTHNYRTYLWSDLSMGSSLIIKKPGVYTLTVTDQNNCSGSDTIVIGVKQCMEGLYVPNAFTPNGDGQNDIFRPLLFGNATSFTFIIYNRWGGKVFESHITSEGWNGKINAQDADKGTYVWICRYSPEGHEEKIAKGTVQLIR
jgi:gliding motility-associated-like protein